MTEVETLCTDWRQLAMNSAEFEGEFGHTDEILAGDWRTCPVGEALQLGSINIDYKNSDIATAVEVTSQALHDLGNQFTEEVVEDNPSGALALIDKIEAHIAKCGGPAQVRKSIDNYLAKHPPAPTYDDGTYKKPHKTG